ncbi:MAG: hypothetical protein AAGE80_13545 [Pseudomonadota bacterium]
MFRIAAYLSLISGLFFLWVILPRPLTLETPDLASILDGLAGGVGSSGPAEATLACGSADIPCKVGQRIYHIALPEGDGPFPVIVMMHGSKGSGARIISGPLRRAALERGYGLIAPTALDVQYAGGETGTGWIFEGRRGTRDDYQFTRNTISDAVARFPVDPDRIILSGFSNGATFAWYFACASTRLPFSSVATLGGTLARGRPESCGRRTPRFSLLHGHGDRDLVLPIEGEEPKDGWIGWESAEKSLQTLLSKANCRGGTEGVSGRFALELWSECANGQRFGFATFSGGHEIPPGWFDLVIDWSEGTL